jgi:hypothetical protein
MKRNVSLLVVLALLCFAMPAIASPPGGLPALEVSSLVADMPSVYAVQEAAPVVVAVWAFILGACALSGLMVREQRGAK